MITVSDFKITINRKVNTEKFQEDKIKPLPPLRILTDSDKNTLTVTEFAEEARITPQAVRKMISKERLGAAKMGHQYLIQKEELFRYLQR
jgi:excisionase family DNA binding protein